MDRRWKRLAFFAFVGALTAACGGAGARAPTWDTPIPASETRATMRVVLDLEPVSDCDERFALGIYQDRGVELVTWDERRGCEGRDATVRYVPGRVRREELLDRMKKLARRVQVKDG